MKERNNPLMKKLDYYIGIPLLYMLGILHKKNTLPNLNNCDMPYHFVLLKTAAIGDTILMSAIIKELKFRYQHCRITFICSKNNVAMARLLNEVDRVVIFNMSHPVSALLAVKKIHNVDIVLDFAPWTRINGLISWIIKANYKIGFKRAGMHRHYIYDKWIEHKDACHEIDNYRAILTALQIPLQKFIPQIVPYQRFDITSLIQGPYVVFHLFPGGASASLRSWQDEKWVELGEKIFHAYGYTIVLTGGREDVSHAKEIIQLFNNKTIPVVSLIDAVSLDQLNCVLRGSVCLVTVNTGIMHLGAAVGIPVIALHGATNYKRWGPVSNKAIVVQTGEKCQPCISLGFESKCKVPVCMQHITVEMVWDKLNEILL